MHQRTYLPVSSEGTIVRNPEIRVEQAHVVRPLLSSGNGPEKSARWREGSQSTCAAWWVGAVGMSERACVHTLPSFEAVAWANCPTSGPWTLPHLCPGSFFIFWAKT